MRGRLTLKTADFAPVGNIVSPPTWYALHLRSVVLVEASRCRCPDMFSFVWRYVGLSRRFCLFDSLHTKFKILVTLLSIGDC